MSTATLSSPPPMPPAAHDLAPVRIGIMGTPVSSGNRGVLALGAALVRLCLDAAPGAEPVLLGSQRQAQPVRLRPHGRPVEVAMVHWRLSPRSGWRHHLAVITAASLVYRAIPALRPRLSATIPWIRKVEAMTFIGDVRGGDSFSDIYGLKRFLLATLPVVSVIAIKGSLVQFPQTYGPYRSWIARTIARGILRRSSRIIARDRASQQVAAGLLGDAARVELSPDVAFALHADRPARIETVPPLPTDAGPRIGINVNGLMFNGGYSRKNMFGLRMVYPEFARSLLLALLAESSGPILLVPHTIAPAGDTESDNEASAILRASLPAELQRRVHIVSSDYDAHQLKGIIGTCDFFLGSRMHSCIAALSQGVPCVGVAYSMKFAGVFESVGMSDWVVDARQIDTPTAIDRVLELYRSRHQRRAGLAAAAEDARAHLQRVFAGLVPVAPADQTTVLLSSS